jgi:hypothetical protein
MMIEWSPMVYLTMIVVLTWSIRTLPTYPTLKSRKRGKIKLRKMSAKHYRRFHWQYPLGLRSTGQYYYRSTCSKYQAFMGMSTPEQRLKCKVAMNDVGAFTAGMSEQDLFSVIWDSGASTSVSSNLHDFADGIIETPDTCKGRTSPCDVIT